MTPKPPPHRLREAGTNLSELELAFDEFFEEGYAYQVNKFEIEQTPDAGRDAAIRELLPKCTQAEGYFTWVRYLVWLDGIVELTAGLQLTSVEAQGLLVLRRARNRFQRTHPPCMHCGTYNEEHNYSCYHCGKEIKN